VAQYIHPHLEQSPHTKQSICASRTQYKLLNLLITFLAPPSLSSLVSHIPSPNSNYSCFTFPLPLTSHAQLALTHHPGHDKANKKPIQGVAPKKTLLSHKSRMSSSHSHRSHSLSSRPSDSKIYRARPCRGILYYLHSPA
jgi:hypothetical protein